MVPFVFIQAGYTAIGPAYSAIFLLGVFWKRVNGKDELIAEGKKVYEITDARWLPATAPGADLLIVGYRPRQASEHLQDVTTSVETVLPAT